MERKKKMQRTPRETESGQREQGGGGGEDGYHSECDCLEQNF